MPDEVETMSTSKLRPERGMKLTGRSKRPAGCYRGGWEGTAIRHVQKIAPRPGEVFRNGFFYTLVRCATPRKGGSPDAGVTRALLLIAGSEEGEKVIMLPGGQPRYHP